MTWLLRIAAATMLLWAPQADARDARADAVIAAAKAATGGAAWDTLDGSWERGKHGDTVYETSLDFRRYGMRMEAGPPEHRLVRGFDGVTDWTIAPDGKVLRDAGGAGVVEAIVTAYASNNGQFFPDRFPATLTWQREVAEGTRHFDAILAVPQGGRGFELWFDRDTHLLARIVDTGGQMPVQVALSDYRKVGPVLVAFHGVISGPDGKLLEEMQVETVVFRAIPRDAFAPPPDR